MPPLSMLQQPDWAETLPATTRSPLGVLTNAFTCAAPADTCNHGGAGEGVGALHHGELVAGRRAAQAGLDVAVRGPAHEAAVELAVLDDAAVVQRLHRIAKALQICGMHASSFEHYRNISIFLTVHINAVNFAFC